MERMSDKHASRVDEEVKEEVASLQRGAPVESHAEEFRRMEGEADDEPVTDSRIAGTTGPAGEDGLAPEAVEARADIARFLDQKVFPADRDTLVANAEAHHAPLPIVETLRTLPNGRTFENVAQIWAAVSGAAD